MQYVRIIKVLMFLSNLIGGMIFLPDFSEAQNIIPLSPGKNYILSIGIDEYRNWPALSNAENDALGITEVLTEFYGYETIMEPILSERATYEGVLSALGKARTLLNPEDNLIVYFAGHGHSKKIKVGSGLTVSYLALHDSEPKNANTELKKIRLEYLLDLLSEMPTKHVCFFIDACESGLALNLRTYRGSSAETEDSSLKIGRKVFTSARANQVALDSGPFPEHSVYTGFLIDGLKTLGPDQDGNKLISMLELAGYVKSKVEDWTNAKQIPDYGPFGLDNRAELVLKPDLEKIEAFNVQNNQDYLDKREKGKQETYTALAFRSLSSDSSQQYLGTWIADTIIQALAENQSDSYKTIRPSIIQNINYAATIPYTSSLQKHRNLQTFTGSYFIQDRELTIKMQLVDFDTGEVLYSFPDIKGEYAVKNELLSLLKQKVQGFLAIEDLALRGQHAVPMYEAFKLVQKALDYDLGSPIFRQYLDRALVLDPDYFYAHHMYVISYLDGPFMNIKKAREYVQKIYQMGIAKTNYEEDVLEGLYHEAHADYDETVELFFSRLNNKNYARSWSTIWSIGFYAEVSNRLSDLEQLFQQVEMDSTEMQFMAGFKLNAYLQQGEADEDFSYYLSISNRRYWSKEIIACYIMFDVEKGERLDSIFEELLTNISVEERKIQMLLYTGKCFEFKGLNSRAKEYYLRAYTKMLSSAGISENTKLQVWYRVGEYNQVIQSFEQNMEEIFKNEQLKAIEFYALSKIKAGENGSQYLEKIYAYLDSKEGKLPHAVAHIKAKISAHTETPEITISKLKKAYKKGLGFGFTRYYSDPDLAMLRDHPEFIAFCKPK